MKYRIKWYIPKTNERGHGTTEYPRAQAQSIADSLNEADEVGAVHTIEAIPAKDKAK